MWRGRFRGPDWIQPGFFLERPIVQLLVGFAAVAYGVFLGIQIPAAVSDAIAMRDAPDCVQAEQHDCFTVKRAFVVDKDGYRKTVRERWEFASEPHDSASSDTTWGMTTSGGESTFQIGEEIDLWLWEGRPVMAGSVEQPYGLYSTTYGHGRWVWKALLVPLLFVLGASMAASGIRNLRMGDGLFSLPSEVNPERETNRTWLWHQIPGHRALGPLMAGSVLGLTFGWLVSGSHVATLWIALIVTLVGLAWVAFSGRRSPDAR